MANLDSAVQSLVKRLETVTARLEQVEKQLASGAGAGGLSAAAAGGAAGGSGDDSASVQEYEALINAHIKPLVDLTAKIGNDEVKTQIGLLEKAVQSQKQFLQIAAASKKPTDAAVIQKLVEPTSKFMAEIGALREKQRANKQFNHLSAISEGIGAIGWVVVEPTPAPFVNEARASSEFYTNKILVEFKKSDQNQVDWVGHWINFLKELANYIKKFHTTGTSWNPRGGDAASAKPGAAAAPAAAGPKGPPPPPPPSAPLSETAAPAKAGPNTGDLFAALNKGDAITSGLKKVDKSQMTHKNPELRAGSVVAADAAPSKKAASAPKAAAGVKKGTPKLELTGNKWCVEWQENNSAIEIKETEPRQTIYIYKCEKSVVKVSGKINALTIDSCKRTAIVFDDAVASCELVNCNSVEVQILGRVPSVAIDKCSGVQLFVSKSGLDVEIVSSKSDSMNVLIPDPSGAPDPIEMPVPEQYKTYIKDNKLVTSTTDHV
jgi:adenylyl cyclase-associated protein